MHHGKTAGAVLVCVRRWTSAAPPQDRRSEEASLIEILSGVVVPSTRRLSPFSHPHGGFCLQSHSTDSLIYRPLAISDFLQLNCCVKISSLSDFIDAAEQDDTLFLLLWLCFSQTPLPQWLPVLAHKPFLSSSSPLLVFLSRPLLSSPLVFLSSPPFSCSMQISFLGV